MTTAGHDGDDNDNNDSNNKLKCIKEIREFIDRYLLKLNLPKVNPNTVSGLSVIASLGFILTLGRPVVAFFFILLALVLDLLDGMIAKKHGLCSEEGHMVDVASDRLSEGIMFVPFFVPWFYLFVLNTFLALGGFAKDRHFILPLRHVFLFYYLFTAVL